VIEVAHEEWDAAVDIASELKRVFDKFCAKPAVVA
jgi:hypothetical protein